MGTCTKDATKNVADKMPTLASWSPDERSILTVDGEGTALKVWDVASGLERLTLDVDDLEGGVGHGVNSS